MRSVVTLAFLALIAMPGLGQAAYLEPPDTIYRDLMPACDLNGDGVEDLVENGFQTGGSAAPLQGSTVITARSGADGRELWRADGLYFMIYESERGLSLARPGLPEPQAAPNLAMAGDWTGDGICDIFTWGLQGRPGGIVTPFLGSPSLLLGDAMVQLIDGANGNVTWTIRLPQESLRASDLFRTSVNERHAGIPTGFHVITGDGWKRILLKTTDVAFNQVEDRFGFVELATQNEIWSIDAVVTEHYRMYNGTGHEIWRHDVTPEGNETVLSWIAGLEDLNGDGQPDVIVDQVRMANPRGNELQLATGDQPYKNGRGMTVLAIDGNPNGNGDTLWSSEVHPLVPVEAKAETEESIERLTWTHARLIPDMNGDGVLDVAAQWLGIEEVATTSRDGAARTHFTPLDGATGAPLWESNVQGWGFLHSLGPERVAAATTDIPSESTGHLPKAARIVAMDARTGESAWTREQALHGGDVAYAMAQWQWYYALGSDADGDGTRDPVMPARSIGTGGSEQVFRATARTAFDRIDGTTGEVAATYETWGLRGMMADCGDGVPAAFVGHSERLAMVRWGGEPAHVADTAAPSEQHVLWNAPAQGSSTLGVNLVSLAAACGVQGDSLWFSTNMERFSFWRQFELYPSYGVIQADDLQWSLPARSAMDLSANVLQDPAFHGARFIQTPLQLLIATAAAALVGTIGGLALAPAVRRRRAAAKRRADPLGIMLVIFLIPTPGLVGGEPGDMDLSVPVLDGIVPEILAADGQPNQPWTSSEPAGDALAATDDEPRPPAPADSPAMPPSSPPSTNWTMPEGGLAIPGGGPYSRFLTSLTAAKSGPHDVATAFMAAAMQGDQTLDPILNPQFSASFEHILGDVDGDGVDDIAMDILCTDYFECRQVGPGLVDPVAWAQWMLGPSYCGPYHVLIAVSGASGTPMWSVPLMHSDGLTETSITRCGATAVIGVAPTAEGPAVLAQRFVWEAPLLFNIVEEFHHDVFLLDGTTGAERWTIPFDGFIADGFGLEYVAENIFIKPHLFAPTGTSPDLQGPSEPQLFLQRIGFVSSPLNTFFVAPGFNRAVEILDSYYPHEWMVGVNLETGAVTYDREILTPTPGRSVIPWPSLVSPFSAEGYDKYYRGYDDQHPVGHQDMAWAPIACCPDVDGDGTADLVTVTREWRDIRTVDWDGRQGFGSSAMAWSGADGSPLYQVVLLHDVEAPANSERAYYLNLDQGLNVRIRSAGDVDGDGGMDLIVQLRLRISDYDDRLFILDGDSGEVLWSKQSMRWQEVYTLGDVDGDGGVDFVFMHWWTQENRAMIYGDGQNVTARGIRIIDGDTGELIRTTTTISAPFDLQAIYEWIQLGGFPDVNGDGVGDYPIEDPIFLSDGLVLHQTTWVSGATGAHLSTMRSAGAFAFPHRMADVTGDGVDDVAMLVGDAIDLWLVYSNGRTGEAISSHRVVSTEIGSYGSLVPKFRIRMIEAGGPLPGVLIGLHLDVTYIESSYLSTNLYDGSTRRVIYLGETIVPQSMYIADVATARGWSFPDATEIGGHQAVAGSTPGTEGLLDIRREAEPTKMEIASDLAAEAWPAAVAFAASFGLALLGGVFLPRRSA